MLQFSCARAAIVLTRINIDRCICHFSRTATHCFASVIFESRAAKTSSLLRPAWPPPWVDNVELRFPSRDGHISHLLAAGGVRLINVKVERMPRFILVDGPKRALRPQSLRERQAHDNN